MKHTTLLLALGLLAASPALPQVAPPAQAEQTVKQLENEWLHVKNIATLDRVLADDFLHVLPGGFVTKTEEMAYDSKHGFRDPQRITRFAQLRVRVYGETAIVNGVVVASDRKGNVLQQTRFTDVFVERNGRWQAVNAQETPVVP